jgi:CheY-like chemotaxis protein/anti-sigma regulatory factor (Ser/Thr protein kinase)
MIGPLNDRQKNAITTIERSGQHLLSLINDILDLSKIETGKLELHPTLVSVVQLCESSLVFVKQQAFTKQVQLQVDVSPDLKEILLDERRMRQVLINLLANAVKFTPSGGQVSLAVHIQDLEGQNWVVFSVHDTGIGISPADQAKLFQPFMQIDSNLNRKYEGTGLGLALVKRLVELHDGVVSLQSEPGRGSCFSVRLPYSSQVEDSLPRTQVKPPQSPLILLAEDNEANISTLSNYLEAKGYRIEVAKNGQEAIDWLSSHCPNLILIDIQMPLMDGLAAIRRIRAEGRWDSIPIIAMTAFVQTNDRQLCLEAGATEYLAKPIRLKALEAIIQQLLVS